MGQPAFVNVQPVNKLSSKTAAGGSPGTMSIAGINGVSVIICCFNSADRIRPTLEHLAAQQLGAGFPWEIILVDNASQDGTAALSGTIWQELRAPTPLHVYTEERQGLSFARQTGIRQSQYECIIFCDDDNWLDNRYLQFAAKLFEQKPEIGIAGGWSEAVTDGKFPADFEKWQSRFAVGSPHSHSKDITDGWQVWGAGMVARRSILVKIYSEQFPFLCTDRKGSQLSSGGDDEICSRAILLGYRLYFSTDLFFRHFISKSRLSVEAMERLQDGFSSSNRFLKRYQFCIEGLWLQQQGKKLEALKCFGKAAGNFLKGKILHARCQFDKFLFCFRLRGFCDHISRTIFDFTNSNNRFVR